MSKKKHQSTRPKTTAQPAQALQAVEGPSFPAFIKVLSTVLVIVTLGWSWTHYETLMAATSRATAVGFIAGATLVVLAGYYGMMIGRTRVDADTIRQSWLWTKRVDLTDVTHIKLVVIPGLTWLIVPRLIVRTKGWGVTTFQAGDARVVAAFRQLAVET